MSEKSPNDAPPSLAVHEALRSLPKVGRLLELFREESSGVPRSVAVKAARNAIEHARGKLRLENAPPPSGKEALEQEILDEMRRLAALDMLPNLRRVINGTGVVVHTNLGRSLLSEEACRSVTAAAGRYSNLEFDLREGRRGSRFSLVEDLLCELTGAESAMVVNNNAGAVLLSLMALAQGKEVVVSRGELVEIGGAFRIPDVMASSGAVLKEVGTTNRTHLRDYENAIGEETGMLLKAHTSNFAVVGFTASVSLPELAGLGAKTGLPVMEDLGSGSLVDFSQYGLAKEPTVMESVAAGADVVTFSGDKMLGGPQAGVILGRKAVLDRIKKHPVARALRIDKMTLAALEATLRHYRDPATCFRTIPTLAMITEQPEVIRRKARRLQARIRKLDAPGVTARVSAIASRVGGGALPLQELASFGVLLQVEGMSANALEQAMRVQDLPVIGRIEEDQFLLDLRTVADDEIPLAARAVGVAASMGKPGGEARQEKGR